ncbi:hypothetical protein GS501_01405 [Saccharibacter sp. 17.LH.SD]|uniref:PepSY-associated TM helix domain-containing protein n=1 Tax=Saccharibacter sp. 17.LH.SD TaxID=2689393 RepID=UPI001368AA2E|nr:PepSY-associated TM helix domain-containing protein [Saccharibacter sp. 17.LH.SD]MXV43713.1 hypothetical protein [Saccharibacter sp. 17.LH.SD]
MIFYVNGVWKNHFRPLFLKLHRYTGLFLSLFLIFEGITGSLSVFRVELDAWLNPDLFKAKIVNKPIVPLNILIGTIHKSNPDTSLLSIQFHPKKGLNGKAFILKKNNYKEEIFFNPYTGEIIGSRPVNGQLKRRHDLIPFIYYLHYSMGFGSYGTLFLGFISLIWVGDCISGLLLTLPLSKTVWEKSFWHNWSKAWAISYKKISFRLLIDLHRAPAMWFWGILLGIAISGVALSLGAFLFQPVIKFVFPSAPVISCSTPPRTMPHFLSLEEAEQTVLQCARQYGIKSSPTGALFLRKSTLITFYAFTLGEKDATGLGSPVISIDRRLGITTINSLPGKGKLADTIIQLQGPWHSGHLLGMTGRILIFLSGIITALLSITGILIFLRKKNIWIVKTKK